MSTQELGDSLIDVLNNSGSSNQLIDAAETAVDVFLDEGLLKDIPIINTVISLYRTGVGLKEYFLLKKLARFLTSLESIEDNKRHEFVKKIGDKPEHRKKVGEYILLLLDRLDDLQKASLAGYLLKAHVLGKFDFSTFQRLTKAIAECNIADLEYLRTFDRKRWDRRPSALPDIALGLVACNLAKPALFIDRTGYEPGDNAYLITELGEVLLDTVLNDVSAKTT
jgi:hypothetical protein